MPNTVSPDGTGCWLTDLGRPRAGVLGALDERGRQVGPCREMEGVDPGSELRQAVGTATLPGPTNTQRCDYQIRMR